jgi:UPF0271 protein
MASKKKSKIFILDTSAVLSGKPIILDNAMMVTTPGISKELKLGGRDYQTFQFLIEKGLTINAPSKESTDRINIVSSETGDIDRLSDVDKEILALALDINKNKEKEAIIITDDYSIQNTAHVLNIKYENISQSGITKKFKWAYQCLGCGKKFKENIKICPICGTRIKHVISQKENIKR